MVNQGTAPGFAVEYAAPYYRWSGRRPDGACNASVNTVFTLREAVRGTWAAYGLPNGGYRICASANGLVCYVAAGETACAPSHEAAQVACWEHWAAQRAPKGALLYEIDLVQKIAELESACARKDLALTRLQECNVQLRDQADRTDATCAAVRKERDKAAERARVYEHAADCALRELQTHAPLLMAAKVLRANLDKHRGTTQSLSAYVAAVIQAVCDFMDATDKIG